MNTNEDEIIDYIKDLDDLAEEILEKTRTFFTNIETESVGPSYKDRYTWLIPIGSIEDQQRELFNKYNEWCAGARELVSEYKSHDLESFEDNKTKFYNLVALEGPAPENPYQSFNQARKLLDTQRGIVNSIPRKIEAEQIKTRRNISQQVAKGELQKARMLLDEDLTRASGVVAGVALERHLLTLCEESEADLDFEHDDGIASLAQTLYEASEIDKTTLSSLKSLSSIRADCAHANEQEPNLHKVSKLIEDTEDYIRGRGI